MAAQQVNIAVLGGVVVDIRNTIGTGGYGALALVERRIEIRGFVAEYPQADRLQEACAHFVRIAVDLYFSSVFKFPIAHMVAVVVIVVHRGGKVPVYAEGKGAGNGGVGAFYFQAVLGACGEVTFDEEVKARAAVVVGGEQGFALVEFTDGVESPGCGEYISSGFRGRKLVPAVLSGGEICAAAVIVKVVVSDSNRDRSVAVFAGSHSHSSGSLNAGASSCDGSDGDFTWGEGGDKSGAADSGDGGIAGAPGYALQRTGGRDRRGELLCAAGAYRRAAGAYGHAGGRDLRRADRQHAVARHGGGCAAYLDEILRTRGERPCDEEVAAVAAVVVGSQYRCALMEFSVSVDGAGCGERIGARLGGREFVPSVLAGGQSEAVGIARSHRGIAGADGVYGHNTGPLFRGICSGCGGDGNSAWGEGGYKAGAADSGDGGVAGAPGYALRRAGGGDGSGELLCASGADRCAVGAYGDAGGRRHVYAEGKGAGNGSTCPFNL